MKLEQIQQTLLTDAKVRRAVTRQNHKWFFSVFLSHYIQYELALFHEDMFALSEGNQKLTVIMAFRGSGKSTIMNLSYVLWAILGIQQKKFILIVSKTQSQAKNHLQNIRDELLQNTLLKQDLGPFESDDSTWGMSSLVLPKVGARIMATSREQSLRGIRYGAIRPDLIICDDVEDLASSGSETEQLATYNWLMSEVLPAGDVNTKVVVLGNLLSEYSLLMRLRTDILSQKTTGVFRAYPFSDDTQQVLWPGKFNTQESIEGFELSVPDEDLWNREYLLRFSPKNELSEMHAWTNACKAGKDPDVDSPMQELGYYRISAPKRTFNMMSSLRRHWLTEFSTLSKTDPAQAIVRLRSMTENYDQSAFHHERREWSLWVSLRNNQLIKSIISAALDSENAEAYKAAVLSMQELVVAGFHEFQELLKETDYLDSSNNLE